MKELEFLEIIKKTLAKSSYIGDDCAYLKKLGIVVTQDSLAEDIHFSMKFSTPYMLAYKAIMVNLSDVFASGAMPKYFTISLSLPKNIDNFFVEEFYRACNDLSKEYDFEIIGGDITGSDKIFISICAIGVTDNRTITSRSNAKVGDVVVTTGVHGSSAAGLWLLQNNIEGYEVLKNAHLMPVAQKSFSENISTSVSRYAQMDTSDGLADALFKIAQASNVMLSVDFAKIPYSNDIINIAKLANVDYRDWVLYGGEDFQLVACVSEENLSKIDKNSYTVIGKVLEKENGHFVEINFDNSVQKIDNLEKTFNHFKE